MKIKLVCIFSIILSISNILSAQNTAPEVTNVTFNQRLDGSFMVDIYYDVNDVDGDTMRVTMQVSEDAGTNWDFLADSIDGNVGSDVLSGTGKHIEWDFGSEHPKTFGNNFRIKIIADDGVIFDTVTDVDGNVYQTIKIGNQWWMAENLKVISYRNGETIHHETDNTAWMNQTIGAYCAYNNDNNNIATYGLLYNWYAVEDSRKIAPTGWHVPTDEDWTDLELLLGMDPNIIHNSGWRGTNEGGKLKTTGMVEKGDGLWYGPNSGATNEYGFSALPGGFREYHTGGFSGIGTIAGFWSTSYGRGRELDYDHSDIGRTCSPMATGQSVRCVKD